MLVRHSLPAPFDCLLLAVGAEFWVAKMNIDDVYSHIGQFGPQQKKYMAVSFVALGFYAAVATFNQQFACK